MVQTYLCLFSQAARLLEFTLPELESVARYFDVPLSTPEPHDLHSPFFKVTVRDEEDLKKMASRLVQVKGFYEIWGEGTTYEETVASVDTHVPPEKMALFTTEGATFRCRMSGFGRKYTEAEQAERIHRFSHLPALRTKVSLNHAQVTIAFSFLLRSSEDYKTLATFCSSAKLRTPSGCLKTLVWRKASTHPLARSTSAERSSRYLVVFRFDLSLDLTLTSVNR